MHRENSGQRPPSQLSFIFCTYIGFPFKYPYSPRVLLTIFTNSIFAGIFRKLHFAVHKSRYAAITSDLNHSVTMQLAIAESHYAASLRFAVYREPRSIVSFESQRTHARKLTRRTHLARDRSVKETHFNDQRT